MVQRKIKATIVSVFVSVCLCIVLFIGVAFVFVKFQRIPLQAISFVTLLCMAISSFTGGYVSGRMRRENGLMIGMASGFTLFIILFVGSLIMTQELSFFSLVKCMLMLLMGAIGGIVGVNKNNKIRI